MILLTLICRYGTIAEHSVGHVSAELFETELMPLLLEKAMVDPVPNVRITAARAMKKLSEHGEFHNKWIY